MKKKLLVWCDSPTVPTGFGNVAKNLLRDMHENFNVSIVGINYFGLSRYDTSKYFIYPVTQSDPLGVQSLKTAIKEESPDVILLFQDIFHIADAIKTVKTLAPNAKIAIYFPIDGSPSCMAWKCALDLADVIITYSDWAIETLKLSFPEIKKPIHKLYHGVDTSAFTRLEQEEILKIRTERGWTNKFVALNVNRYQPRKAVPQLLRAFSLFAKGYIECSCGNIMPLNNKRCDLNGCSSKNFIKVHDEPKDDVVLYLHMRPVEPHAMGPGRANTIYNHIWNAGFNDADSSRGMIQFYQKDDIYIGGFPESEVNKLYNAANVNVTTTMGEGCGLSLLEAAACGTSSIAPLNSAVPEQLRYTGILVPNKYTYAFQMDNGHIRPLVDVVLFKEALEVKYKEWKDAGVERAVDMDCVNNVTTNFLWDDKRKILTDLLLGLIK